MSGSEKSISFTFRIDEQSLSRLKSEIRDVTAAMSKLVQSASGMNPGGAGRGPIAMGGGGPVTTGGAAAAIRTQNQQTGGGLAQAFVEAGRSMKDMANISKDSLRVMSDGVRRAIDEQQRSLGALDRDLKKIIADYDELASKKSSLATGPGGKLVGSQIQGQMDGLSGQVLQTQGQRNAAAVQLGQLQAQQQAIVSAQNPPPPGSPGAGAGPGAGGGGGPGWGARFIRGVGIVGAATAAAGVVGSEVMHQFRDPIEISARRAEVVRNRIETLMAGDFRSNFALKNLSVEQKRDIAEQTRGLARAGQTASAGQHLLSGVPVVGGMLGGGADSGMNGLGHGAGFKGEVQETDMAKNALDLAERTRQGGRGMMMDIAIGQWQNQMESRVQAKRMMGVRSLHQDPKTGEWVDPYSQLSQKLTGDHYDIGELASARTSLRSGAGSKFAGQNAYAAMAANAEGLGGFGDLLSTGARAGGGNRFAYGAIGGGIDRSAGMGLGGAILGSGFDPRGTTSGLGTLAAAQAGMGFDGGVGDFRRVQQLGAGLQLGNSVVGGGLDSYQAGRNLVSAIGLKGGSDVYTQDYLANGMNTRQMMDAARGGELTETAKALGLSSGDIRDQLGSSVSSVLDERMPGVDANSAMGKALSKYQNSGQDLPAYLSGLKGADKQNAVKTLGAAYGIATGQGEEAGIGLLGATAGLDEKTTLKLGGVGGRADTMEAAADKAKSAMEGVANEALKAAAATGNLTKAIKDAPLDLSTYKDFGIQLKQASDQFIGALLNIAALMNERFPKASTTKAVAPSSSTSVVRGGKLAG